jgi:hypothetical protein
MTRRGEYMFHAAVKVYSSDLEYFGELKYTYQRIGTTQEQRMDPSKDGFIVEVEHERTKSRKYLHLNSFFDFLSSIRDRMAVIGKNEPLHKAIQFFIQSFDQSEHRQGKLQIFHFGKP